MVSPHNCFVGGVQFPQGEGSAVRVRVSEIHRKKNDLLYKGMSLVCVIGSGRVNFVIEIINM